MPFVYEIDNLAYAHPGQSERESRSNWLALSI